MYQNAYFQNRRRDQMEVQRINTAASELLCRSYLIEKYYQLVNGSSDGPDQLTQDIVIEREDLVRDFTSILGNITNFRMEFTAAGFVSNFPSTDPFTFRIKKL